MTDTITVRDYLLFEHLLTHHVAANRDSITHSGARGIVLMPSIARELMEDYGALVEIPYIYTRVWAFEDSWNGQSADSWLAILDERIPNWRDLCKAANDFDKKIGFIITNEVGADPYKDEDFILGFSNFTAEVLDRLAEVPGAWGVVGNQAMGTISQAWFNLFMTDAMVERLQAGQGIFGIHEYAYVHPAGLMRYTFRGEEYNFLAGNYMPEKWPPPVPAPENLHEAHLIGRFPSYVNIPRWLPWIVTESGFDHISVDQAKAWGAPYRTEDDGSEDTFGGVRTLLPFIGNHWGATNPARFYVQEYLDWIEPFYYQWNGEDGLSKCFGVAHFATGDDFSNFEEFDLDSSGGGGEFLRAAIAVIRLAEEIPPWNWAQHVLSLPPVPEPPHNPPKPIDVLYTKEREAQGPPESIWRALEFEIAQRHLLARRVWHLEQEAKKHGWNL